VLERKLEIPRPTFPVLRRPHLIERFDGSTRHRVTLLCAPPGAGKTVACATWATAATSAADTHAVAWLTLDRADNDPGRFWAHAVAALARTQDHPDAVPAPAHGPHGVPGDEFFLQLIEAISRFGRRAVLILDDVHEISDGAVLSGLDFVVRHAPPTLHVILSGRRQPELQLARLRVAGDLVDVGGADLCCRRREVPEYLRLFGLSPDAADCDELLCRTEGWMAGLRLLALRIRDEPTGSLRVGDITGDDPVVADYLRDEVLDRLTPEVHHFMLRTCVVDDLTGQLADALTGGFGGAQILDRLTRENGLVEAVDPGRTRFRYHRLLRECLRAELHRELPREERALLAKAARWYARHGRALDALRCSVAAEDWDHAARVLAEEDIRILLGEDRPALESVLRRIPMDQVLGAAALAAALAAARLWAGDPQDAEAYLSSAGDMLERTAPPLRRLVAPKLVMLRLIRACAHGRADARLLAAAWEAAAEAAGTPVEHRANGTLYFFLGMAHLRASEIERSVRALRAADRELGLGSARDLQVRARAWSALAGAWAGELRAAEQGIGEIREKTRSADAAAAVPGVSSIAELALASIRLERDDLAGARQLVDGVDTKAEPLPAEPPLDVLAGLVRARVLTAQGEPAAATAALPQRTGMVVTELIDLADAEIAVRRADLGRARRILAAHADQGGGHPQARVLLGRLLLDDDDPEGAAAAVDALLLTEDDGNTTLRERTAALLVVAGTHRRLHSVEHAAELLEQALSLAEPGGAYRVFLDGGTAVRSMLTVLIAPHSRNVRFRNRLLRRFDGQLPVGGSHRSGAAHGLTGSELAVLRFLPSHMTNDEIAAALFLSVNTVKSHLRSVYRKLGVGTRRAAIAQATRLGLL
jgi:LuxR family maltose regulon positive regulatory protein